MSVVLHRSAGKMILKSFVAAIALSFAWIKSVAGSTAYSNVYMQSGPGLAFYEPAALRSGQLAPLAAAPLISSFLPPCVSPCTIPSQQVAALNPVATSSANFVPFKSPVRVPVIVAPSNDDATSYEYSYVVYDEGTGDQKAQKETSDGSVVRGQYSLIQPDGYVREVEYTADDVRGFNAVVKNFLPEKGAKAIPPNPDVKNEPLKKAQEKTDESHDLEPEAHADAHKEEHGHGGESHEKQEAPTEPEKHGDHGHNEIESHVQPPEPDKHKEHKNHDEHEGHEAPKGQKGHAEPKNHGVQGGHEEHGNSEEHSGPKKYEEHGKPEAHEEPHSAEEHGRKEKNKEEPRATQGTEMLPAKTDALVSYNDVIKCIQSAIKGANTPQTLGSPLTYIILNKPC